MDPNSTWARKSEPPQSRIKRTGEKALKRHKPLFIRILLDMEIPPFNGSLGYFYHNELLVSRII
jgi:hypothetical protein